MKIFSNIFDHIISPENLFSAWEEFKKDKQQKLDVQRFEFDLERNLFQLQRDLKDKTYIHGPYEGFYICDPKVRHIHKAIVRDRVLHHAICKVLNPIFEPTFIPTSFSCRVGYGTHRGVAVLEDMVRKVSRNNTSPCYILKCDIKKFFDTVDHGILLSILSKRIKDEETMWLLEEIIESFPKGLPIGNLTSQIFANIYMNEFDQFVKHTLKAKYYVRYTDDFAIVSDNEYTLRGGGLTSIEKFLKERLKLTLHPKKVFIRKLHQGIDFLGYVIFPKHRLVRRETKCRIFAKLQQRVREYHEGRITELTLEQSLQSYLGVLSHANAYGLSQDLRNQLWLS